MSAANQGIDVAFWFLELLLEESYLILFNIGCYIFNWPYSIYLLHQYIHRFVAGVVFFSGWYNLFFTFWIRRTYVL